MRAIWQVLKKLLAAYASIAIAVLLFKFALLPLAGLAIQPASAGAAFVRGSGILLSAILGYRVYARYYEKRAVAELKPAPIGILAGIASGTILISITTASLFALGAYVAIAYYGFQRPLLGVAGVILVAAMLEEIVFRGVLFQILTSARRRCTPALRSTRRRVPRPSSCDRHDWLASVPGARTPIVHGALRSEAVRAVPAAQPLGGSNDRFPFARACGNSARILPICPRCPAKCAITRGSPATPSMRAAPSRSGRSVTVVFAGAMNVATRPSCSLRNSAASERNAWRCSQSAPSTRTAIARS
jgi:hypothetical protein